MHKVKEHLAQLLGTASSDVRSRGGPGANHPDAVISAGDVTFVVEWRASGATAPVSAAAEQARRQAGALGKHAIPLVAVPFMGPIGRQRCAEAGVAWLDLSGNARIVAPGIRILIEGEPSQFKTKSRSSSVFAPKGARITRWLLMHPNKVQSQREIAQATGMDEGYTSRITARLEEDDLIIRDEHGAIRPRDPDLLLDAWRENYNFSKHEIVRGHVPARSGDGLLRQLAQELRKHGGGYAATGLAAAWLLTRFSGFRLVTIYLSEHPSSDVLARLRFREEGRGANVWLVIPKDQGVFHGVADRDGVACVHPVQAYLDLQDHPERAKEAADHLRAELLDWSTDA
jgi:hypothetical protein